MPPTASIIILTYNNLDYTRLCLDSIFVRTAGLDFELIIVDNASTDGTPEFLRALAADHPQVRLVLNEANEGFARGNNRGAALAQGDVLVFLNNDTVVTQGWLAGLTRYLQDATVGMVGPVTNSSGNQTRIRVDYSGLEDMQAFAATYTRQHAGQAFEISMLPLQCAALRRSVFSEVGSLDERFGQGMFEDDDYALRLHRKGYRILCAEDVFVHHWGSASFSKIHYPDYWKLFKENLKKFEDKWGQQWLPHLGRPEFIPQQLRQSLDDRMWMAGVLAERERDLEYLRQLHASQAAVLEGLYGSNGWRLLQGLLRLRRALIPEGSRREILFRRLMRAARGHRPGRPAPSASPPAPAVAEGAPEGAPSGAPYAQATPAAAGTARTLWPLVSVILPVYNHADLLEGAARSVLDNTYPNLELIILDDGSSDDIEPVLAHLSANPRVRILRQPNQKLPRALTHAHSFARGELITWTSADNLLAPAALETLVRTLLEHPRAVLAYADVALIDDASRPLPGSEYRPHNRDLQRPEILRLYRDARPLSWEADNFINACFLYRREAAQALEGRFADDLVGLEDFDFWLRLQAAGPFCHARNDEPLYFYRVHDRTMSHAILAGQAGRADHFHRLQQFMEYTALRRQAVERRWTLVLDEALSPDWKDWLAAAAGQLPADVQVQRAPAMQGEAAPPAWEPGAKRLRCVPRAAGAVDGLHVRLLPETLQLCWRSPWDGQPRQLEVWRGTTVHPLALKARQYQPDPAEFPAAGGRPVIGCHAALADLPLDVPLLRQTVEKNPEIYFVFADLPGRADPGLGAALCAGLENAAYLGERAVEASYPLYAGMAAMWLPPVARPLGPGSQRGLLALAYAAGRPFLVPHGCACVPAPYQYCYHPPGDSLAFAASPERETLETGLLDRYLESWSPAGCLAQLLRYASAVWQESALARPDFGLTPPPASLPQPWRPASLPAGGSSPARCLLVADSLDRGGVESFIAQMARRLPEHGLEAVVLCTRSGGATAEVLKKEGLKVYIAGGDEDLLRTILKQEQPRLASTHLAGLPFLQAAAAAGLPVVETIHSPYVWLQPQDWQQEARRSRFFSRAIASSAAACRYYVKWNPAMPVEWIYVVPNGVDSQRLQLVDRARARQELGLDESEFLFVSLGSYEELKNQVGLLAAFDELAAAQPAARLVCAGNIVSPRYHRAVSAFQAGLPSRERIHLYEYRSDAGRLLSAADAFVLDSFSEGWSLAATEALLAGLPLIHSDCGSAYELAGLNGERGLVVSNPAAEPINLGSDLILDSAYLKRQRNTPELAAAMRRLIAERQFWVERREAIRSYAREHFSFEKTLNRYLEIYRELLGKQVG